MRLIDYYHQDQKGLGSKAASRNRSLWHSTITRYLNLMSITSDPAQPLTVRKIKVDVWDMSETAETYDTTILPFTPFFFSRGDDELEEVYRATKPRKK
ncbi:hypothetical protein QH494_02665 [Sphingomonas sp. AR_OL41]|uniref:hypothetical protein n=1 Tax=Sphingomonas sp. AR_OL41 TaxID=3042729 RepID=UPI00247FC0E4|nr:hypothetical protein [Sphingomonas sp. AR_OL41]MDH7971072.1 hypothetical protein [Sphingomonas sp. AR_OL41]